MAGGNLFGRALSYVVNEFLVEGLANNRAFQRFAVKTNRTLESLSSKGNVFNHYSALLEYHPDRIIYFANSSNILLSQCKFSILMCQLNINYSWFVIKFLVSSAFVSSNKLMNSFFSAKQVSEELSEQLKEARGQDDRSLFAAPLQAVKQRILVHQDDADSPILL
ncbi:unnamed protein product [Urochloa decumbens]|uniref:Uncharacterized protein n=1 Tax=Urochloa decumbens TaxID=240449 RepID=A0ABC9CAD8_9POAL